MASDQPVFEIPAGIPEAKLRLMELDTRVSEISLQLSDATRRDLYEDSREYTRWRNGATLALVRIKKEILFIQVWRKQAQAKQKILLPQNVERLEARVEKLTEHYTRIDSAKSVANGKRLAKQRAHLARITAVAVDQNITDITNPFQIIQTARPLLKMLALDIMLSRKTDPEKVEKALGVAEVMIVYLESIATEQAGN